MIEHLVTVARKILETSNRTVIMVDTHSGSLDQSQMIHFG